MALLKRKQEKTGSHPCSVELSLAWQANQLYDERELDPGQVCQMIKPRLDNPMSLF